MIQNFLVGKAAEVSFVFADDQRKDYDAVKDFILKAYRQNLGTLKSVITKSI